MPRHPALSALVTGLLGLVLASCSGDGSSQPGGLDAAGAKGEDSTGHDSSGVIASPGCGLESERVTGGVQVSHLFSDAAGGERSFFLSIPESYDPSVPARLYVGYAGTGWLGAQIQPYLGLETEPVAQGEIYVYPDVQWHDFEGWGNLGGWLLGPHATPADGLEDLEFTRELVSFIGERYCVDTERVFATGHSWGGDMTAVVGCFLGDLFRAVAPTAANRPYWFEPEEGAVECLGSSAVWTFFGQQDDHFSWQEYPGQMGDEQVAFWRAEHGCGEGSNTLEVGGGECERYEDCAQDTRYCLYSSEAGHQVPSYFSSAVLAWFRSF